MIAEANAGPTGDDTREPALIARAQQGDTDAFGELYAMHHEAIAAFVRQRVGNHRQRTEDVTAEVFLRAFRKLDTFTWKGKSLRAWLFTIARNMVADHYKALSTKRLTYVDDIREESDYWGTPDCATEDVVLAGLQNSELHAAVGELTGLQRKVIVLRFFGDLTVEETAVALGRSAGATKTVQYRAVRSLQRIIGAGVAA